MDNYEDWRQNLTHGRGNVPIVPERLPEEEKLERVSVHSLT